MTGQPTTTSAATDRDVDVLVVGAGISGIGAAWHLRQQCPGQRIAVLEGRSGIGGTWDLFRYPGIRSDSDMHTLGFGFRPWREARAIADGPSILDYLKDTVNESALAPFIHFARRVVAAAWDGEQQRWLLDVRHNDEHETWTTRFLHVCSGYYDYEQPHVPQFEGIEDFAGTCVHAQHWPDDLDYADQRVVVVGSGATAVTLVPAMAPTARRVTMVQRSPTWIVSMPAVDRLAETLRRNLPAKWAYTLTRIKNIAFQRYLYHRTRVAPDKVAAELLRRARRSLGPDVDVDKHFTPAYAPWDQRLCLVPDSDLFRALRGGKAHVVTGDIERFETDGLRMKDGELVAADLVVLATGLRLKLLGGIEFTVDGEPVDFASRYSYKGMMVEGVPNMLHTFGYINASWTLRVDLNARFLCRLVETMEQRRVEQVTPRLRPEDADMVPRPWIDGFSSGYVQRSIHLFPRQGDHDPWRNTQNYLLDRRLVGRGSLDDGALVFGPPPATARAPDAA